MYIYLDINNYVYAYGSEYEEHSVQVDSVPAEVDKYLGAYQYIDGQYILDESRKNILDKMQSYEKELSSLLSWFDWYDEQIMQYHRSQRLNVEFDKDIEELDNQAKFNADRINFLRSEISKKLEDY